MIADLSRQGIGVDAAGCIDLGTGHYIVGQQQRQVFGENAACILYGAGGDLVGELQAALKDAFDKEVLTANAEGGAGRQVEFIGDIRADYHHPRVAGRQIRTFGYDQALLREAAQVVLTYVHARQ
ncbi:MAG: hypothetical protein BWY79_02132 [Actinobacteria bacterium ADurb.Bin444]|nr:MAG: hypothetical protein BWY79_02132 [Actinobacteria bacterium ADurb.Bin444]